MSGASLKCLALCLNLGIGKMQHPSVCTEMGQGPFWTLNFDWHEELKFGRSKLVWKECRGPMGIGVESFLQPTIGACPLMVEGNSAFQFPDTWKSQGSMGALDNFWGGLGLSFSGKALLLSCVCTYISNLPNEDYLGGYFMCSFCSTHSYS